MIKIVIADDHKILRQGLKVLLESEPEFQVVGEASNGLEAIELVENLHPDVLVTDLRMPGADGIQVTIAVKKAPGNTRVIILSMYGGQGLCEKGP